MKGLVYILFMFGREWWSSFVGFAILHSVPNLMFRREVKPLKLVHFFGN